jgi:hypothetical protein
MKTTTLQKINRLTTAYGSNPFRLVDGRDYMQQQLTIQFRSLVRFMLLINNTFLTLKFLWLSVGRVQASEQFVNFGMRCSELTSRKLNGSAHVRRLGMQVVGIPGSAHLTQVHPQIAHALHQVGQALIGFAHHVREFVYITCQVVAQRALTGGVVHPVVDHR